MAQRSTIGQVARPQAWLAGVRFSARLVSGPLSALGRIVAGPGGGPRQYPRDGFPEIELHEIVAGRRDRFDGLL
jgi:hypothetical protein